MTDHNNIINEIADIQRFLRRKKSRVHLLGICGVGMAGLAFLLKQRGFKVTGCDQAPNQLAAWLRKRGIPVSSGHNPSHVIKTDWLVRSSAVAENNPEIKAAQKAEKRIFRRGLMLAALSSGADSICVCGTHGKSTTTAMIVQLLQKAGLKPSFCIGGEVPALGGVAGWSQGNHIVVEADESDGTLAFYEPAISVITNIEFDHAEHFPDFRALKKCFAKLVKKTGRRIIYCADDRAAGKMLRGHRKSLSYGFSSNADLRLTKWKDASSGLVCRLEFGGKPLGRIKLPVPGRYNALNAAAACAVGLELGIPFVLIARALSEFQPVRRRFEKIVDRKDLLVISDYAHHPTEIAALLSGTRALKIKRWLAVFQPHRYSRTKALGRLFPPAFRGVDELILCPVYEASEAKITGGTSWDLYEHFRHDGKIKTVCARSLKPAWDYLQTRLAPGAGVLIIGAGDVVKIGAWAKKALKSAKWRTNQVERWQREIKRLPLKNSSLKLNEPLRLKTTLRVGGSADIYIETGDSSDLARIVRWAGKNHIPVRIIGAGSNALISDLGARGIVLRLKGTSWRNIRRESDHRISIGAGLSLQELVCWAARDNMTGVEFLTGIPGTVGGAVRMNAGAWNREIGALVGRVKVMEKDGTVKILKQPQLGFAYRRCAGLENRIVLEAELVLKNGNPDNIRAQMSQIRKRRKWMQGLKSAGSIFKNPVGDSAGRLIESLGLKGRMIGGAKISKRHANIIVNEKGATASDMLALIEITRQLVKMKYGVELANEVEYIE